MARKAHSFKHEIKQNSHILIKSFGLHFLEAFSQTLSTEKENKQTKTKTNKQIYIYNTHKRKREARKISYLSLGDFEPQASSSLLEAISSWSGP